MLARDNDPPYDRGVQMRKKQRIYLDVCCLNRFFDDQTQDRVRLESEALLAVLGRVERGELQLLSSEAIDIEVEENPDIDRRMKVRDTLGVAVHYTVAGVREWERARVLKSAGLRTYDALHLACAEAARADVLLTTDDNFVLKAGRSGLTAVQVCNPLRWVAKNEVTS
jgi:predicted nucleic acid-binding protein